MVRDLGKTSILHYIPMRPLKAWTPCPGIHPFVVMLQFLSTINLTYISRLILEVDM